jgi:hypothetical protein
MGFEVVDQRGRDRGWQHLRQIHDAACKRRYFERERKRREG